MVQIYSGKVGQWAKKNAIAAQRRHILIVMLVATLSLPALGFLAGLTLHGGAIALAGAACSFLAVFCLWRLTRTLDSIFETNAKRRLQNLRGGQAEAYISMLIRDNLNDKWHLFDNLMLDANSDIDHVLIGPLGLFVISTKSQRGHFKFDPNGMSGGLGKPMFNDKPVNWPSDAINQALRLRTLLPHMTEDPKQKPPWVQAVLALPFAHIEAPQAKSSNGEKLSEDIPSVGKCWVLHEDTLLDAIEPEQKHRKLSKLEIARWVAALEVIQGKCGSTWV